MFEFSNNEKYLNLRIIDSWRSNLTRVFICNSAKIAQNLICSWLTYLNKHFHVACCNKFFASVEMDIKPIIQIVRIILQKLTGCITKAIAKKASFLTLTYHCKLR